MGAPTNYLIILIVTILTYVARGERKIQSGIDPFARFNTRMFNSMRPEYLEIDRWLVENVDESQSHSDNVAAALLHIETTRVNMTDSARDAWSDFVSLGKIIDGNRCTTKSVDILRKNARRSGLERMFPLGRDLNTLLRVQNIVLSYMIQHSLHCAAHYADEYEKTAHVLHPKDVAVVRSLSRFMMQNFDLMDRYFSPADPEKMYLFSDIQKGKSNKVAQAVCYTIEKNEKHLGYNMETSRSGYIDLTESRNLRVMLVRVVNICRVYSDLVGDIFKAAQFDARTSSGRYYGSKVLSEGWIDYRVCKSFLKSDKIDIMRTIITNLQRSNK